METGNDAYMASRYVNLDTSSSLVAQLAARTIPCPDQCTSHTWSVSTGIRLDAWHGAFSKPLERLRTVDTRSLAALLSAVLLVSLRLVLVALRDGHTCPFCQCGTLKIQLQMEYLNSEKSLSLGNMQIVKNLFRFSSKVSLYPGLSSNEPVLVCPGTRRSLASSNNLMQSSRSSSSKLCSKLERESKPIGLLFLSRSFIIC
jgi:hypothetical protein